MSRKVLASLSSIPAQGKVLQRSEWAEYVVEDLLSVPLISEFVFRSPRMIGGRKKEEEVADFLLLQDESGILIQQKTQDKDDRTSPKVELWARKQAKKAWDQLRRAFTRPKDQPVWCDHPRLGRKEFPQGLPSIQHGLVIVDVLQVVNLQPDADELPLDFAGVPISYLSVNDFLNLVVNLRTIPELLEYLAARRMLVPADLRVIGDEKTLLDLYLLNQGSFNSCLSRADARIVVAAQQERLQDALARKRDSDVYAGLIEYVADALATRHESFQKGLPPELLAAYDPPDQRKNYLAMQAALSGLRLRERAVLGRALSDAAARLTDQTEGFFFLSARFDSKPDWVYILGSSKGLDRTVVISRVEYHLLPGALAFYGKKKCLVVIDRDGVSYEVALSKPGVEPTPSHLAEGRRLYGHLRIASAPLQLVPE